MVQSIIRATKKKLFMYDDFEERWKDLYGIRQ